ncbi:MAG TPA: bifunctional hydroxymethylpyrimidine kinase/phosphomethylpyrimidine kinase [Bryobacteraceae bacterium]|nr:bifunctional hydroxymethylpyrimidine kinase/phosphomethylpyrimidine kinase [Bryobacteraceae bacterium]
MVTPVALSIAGSDPSGGAGLQADLKTFHRLGVYGEAAVTLITVQNTRGVHRVEVLDPDLVAEQIHAVVQDIPPKAAKVGALGNRGVVEAVAKAAESFAFPLVIDPVILAKNGTPLLDAAAERVFLEKLVPRAFLLTPNLHEASKMAGIPVHSLEEMARAAEKLVSLGAENVLVKGGHLEGDAIDVLAARNGELRMFKAPRIATPHTHGTGCTYSAAITAELAKGFELHKAIESAKAFVTEAIRTGPGLGGGAGPLNHFARF